MSSPVGMARARRASMGAGTSFTQPPLSALFFGSPVSGPVHLCPLLLGPVLLRSVLLCSALLCSTLRGPARLGALVRSQGTEACRHAHQVALVDHDLVEILVRTRHLVEHGLLAAGEHLA